MIITTADIAPDRARLFDKADYFCFGLCYAAICLSFLLQAGATVIPVLIVGIVIVHFFFNRISPLVYPAIITPFMFMLRIPDPENVVLTVLPNIVMILSILLSFPRLLTQRVKMDRTTTLLLVLFVAFAILFSLVLYFHVIGMGLFLPLARDYILPLLYAFVFMYASLHNNLLPQVALRAFIVALMILAVISLLRYFQIITIFSEVKFLNAVLVSGGKDGALEFIATRNMPIVGFLSRINLLTGGSVGSSGAVFIATALMVWAGNIFQRNRLIAYILAGCCFWAGALTVSFSVLIPLSLFGLLVILHRIKNSRLMTIASVTLIVPLIIIIWYGYSFEGDTAFSHAAAVPRGFTNLLRVSDFFNVLFGIGPVFFARGFSYTPEGYSYDLGIIRVYQESGIFIFSAFILFLGALAYKAIKIAWKRPNLSTFQFAFPFLVLCLLVHQNFLIGPPFSALFAISLGGLLVCNYQDTDVAEKAALDNQPAPHSAGLLKQESPSS